MNSDSDKPVTAKQLLAHGEQLLQGVVEQPRREARLLLRLAANLSDTRLFADPGQTVSADDAHRFQTMLERRSRHEPIAYIGGEREFWSLPLRVTADTLIPRPETELLVSTALETIQEDGARVLDLGTGSGAIALALASERPGWQITATDLSEAALTVAESNGKRLDLSVEWLPGDWFSPVAGRHFDLILSNPPYIAEHDAHLTQGDVRFEPRSALVAGHDGLDDIRRILRDAPAHLAPGGWLMFEHGFDQGEAVRHLMHEYDFRGVETRRDLAGQDRLSLGRRPPQNPAR